MNKNLSKIVASVLLTTSVAFGAVADTVESDSVGNYLVTPTYYATGGYETHFSVINPSRTNSIVAKVVIREGECSGEVRDFLIYLTPGDKFDAKIFKEGDAIYVSSDDDSVEKTFKERLSFLQLGQAKDAKAGYVEIFALAEYTPGIYTTFTAGKPAKKSELVAAYENGAASAPNLVDSGLNDTDGVANGNPAFTGNLMTGTVSLVNSTTKLAMTVPMTAVEIEGLRNGIFGEKTINTAYNRVIVDADSANNDTMQDLFDSLKKSWVYLPFTAGQQSRLNLAFIGKNVSNYACTFPGGTVVNKRDIKYKMAVRDNSEKEWTPAGGIFSGKPGEVGLLNELDAINIGDATSASSFKSGWVSFNLPITDGTHPALNYQLVDDSIKPGVAVVPSLMQVIEVGGAKVTNYFTPASN